VNRPGHNLLADAALTRDQDLRVRTCDTIDLLFERRHLGATPGQLNVRPRTDRTDRAYTSAACAAFSHTINHCS
jgi:hypothetical protein